MHKLNAICGASVLSLAIAGTLASARAEAADSDRNDASKLDEVIVTAQRRNESLQDVPIAVTALAGDMLERSGVRTAEEIELVTPGLSYSTVGSYAMPRIRGVGTNANAATIENPVALYVDGVYYAYQAGSSLSLNNIEQVEVIKGPQGTLFGRNATGGLIQVTTRRPTSDTSGRVSVGYSDYDTFTSNLYLSGGVGSTVAADVALYYRDQNEGYGRNLATGQDVQIMKNFAGRSKWLWTPSDATEITFIVDVGRDDGAIALAPAPGTTALGGSVLPPAQDVDVPAPYRNENEQEGASVRIAHEFDKLDFVSTSAYRNANSVVLFPNATNNPETMTLVTLKDNFEQYSQEFQLLSRGDGPLEWTAGIFLFGSEGGWEPVGISGLPIAPLNSINISNTQETQSAAVYAQGTYALTDATNLTLGARYTWDRREWNGSMVFDAPFPIPTVVDDGKLSYNEPTWRVAVDHRFSPALLGYVSMNRGFKSGGFNDSVVPASPYDPETLDAYEIGAKAQLADSSVYINAAAFYYDYKNIQVSRYANGNILIYNGAGAEVYGVDLEIQLRLTSQFHLSAGFSVLDHEYTEFPNADITTPQPGGGTLITTGSAQGNRLSNTPDFTANISAEYQLPISTGNADFNVTYYYNDGWYANPDNRLRQPSYNLLNTSASWTTSDDAWQFTVYGRNLFDEEYAVFLSAQANGDSFQYGPPRTYGFSIERRF
ncbi:MAG: TonB-dependent receptor [Steroidobacteraceae bacterium]